MSVAVRLPVFEGPLDLLLHLIRTHKLDIHDIPIARIAEQYLEYLALLEALDLEVASEFLVMAATLMEIKSRCLLPRPEPDDPEDEGPDPRQELVRRLLEYQEICQAADRFRALAEEAGQRFPRPAPAPDPRAPLVPVSPGDLLEALRRALGPREGGGGRGPVLQLRVEPVRIEERVAEVWEAVRAHEGLLPFRALFARRPRRREIIVTFIAVLELLRQQRIQAWQQGAAGEILLAVSGEGNSPSTAKGIES